MQLSEPSSSFRVMQTCHFCKTPETPCHIVCVDSEQLRNITPALDERGHSVNLPKPMCITLNAPFPFANPQKLYAFFVCTGKSCHEFALDKLRHHRLRVVSDNPDAGDNTEYLSSLVHRHRHDIRRIDLIPGIPYDMEVKGGPEALAQLELHKMSFVPRSFAALVAENSQDPTTLRISTLTKTWQADLIKAVWVSWWRRKHSTTYDEARIHGNLVRMKLLQGVGVYLCNDTNGRMVVVVYVPHRNTVPTVAAAVIDYLQEMELEQDTDPSRQPISHGLSSVVSSDENPDLHLVYLNCAPDTSRIVLTTSARNGEPLCYTERGYPSNVTDAFRERPCCDLVPTIIDNDLLNRRRMDLWPNGNDLFPLTVAAGSVAR